MYICSRGTIIASGERKKKKKTHLKIYEGIRRKIIVMSEK